MDDTSAIRGLLLLGEGTDESGWFLLINRCKDARSEECGVSTKNAKD